MSDRFDWDRAKGHIDNRQFWHIDEIKELPFTREEFNDPIQLAKWKDNGLSPRVGMMYDMKHAYQPPTTDLLIKWAHMRDLRHIGISYYKMQPGDNLPYHSDTYARYIQLHNLDKKRDRIYRYLFFVEARLPGHIMEVDGHIVDWIAGDYVAWKYDTPHMAANLGPYDRYTIQLTGVWGEN